MQPVPPAEFEDVVADALDALPPELTEAFRNVLVVVEDEHAEEPDLLGLYEGVPLTERETMAKLRDPQRADALRDYLG